MAIRDENDNKVTPLIPQTNDDEVIKTAIWKFDVEEAMSKVDHGRYEYNPNGKIIYDTKPAGPSPDMPGLYRKTAVEIDFKKTLRYLPAISDKTNAMIFIKPSFEQPYNHVGRDNCENACFAIVITKHDEFNNAEKVYDMALFGLRDGWLNAKITEHDNRSLIYSFGGEYWDAQIALLSENKNKKAKAKEYLSSHSIEDIETFISIQGPAVLLKYSRVKAESPALLTKHIDNLISNEYRLFMSDDIHKVEAPDCISTYLETRGNGQVRTRYPDLYPAYEKQACQALMWQLNAWPEGVRSHSELLEAVVNKVGTEKIESVGKRADEYLDLLVAKEHWLDMKAANEKGLLYPSGPFSGMIQPGECADPDKMLEMIDINLKHIMNRTGNCRATTKPLHDTSDRGEK